MDLLPAESRPPTPKPGNYQKKRILKFIFIRIDQSKYTITIVTSSEADSGTDSGVFMTIYGDKNHTKQFLLSTSDELFKKNKTNRFEFELIDVGKINKINIGQDGKGLHPIWHLQTVEIEKDSETYK